MSHLTKALRELWEKKPLLSILVAGLLFRLIAVLFSKGYGWHDDHFLVIEPAGAWAAGANCQWLPSEGAANPNGKLLFYPGIHYYIFLFLRTLGITDPQSEMYVIRGIHALWSLLTIFFGYKIAFHFGGRKSATQAGLLLSLLWFYPMFSVRQLPEMVCVPPLLLATWLLVNPKSNGQLLAIGLAGFLCGLSFNFRYQTLFISGGLTIVLLYNRKWKQFFIFSIVFLISVFSVQGIVDIIIWKQPFAEIRYYILSNIQHASEYPNGPWYNYLLLILGLLLPPVSLFLLFGYFRSFRKYPILFLPSFLFLLFHSSFPNKQERFILPVIPFIIILGTVGWYEFLATSRYWEKHTKLLRNCMIFFWSINAILLYVITTTYSKKNRVETMSYLSQQKDLHNFIVEQSNTHDITMLPYFYANRWDFHPSTVTLDNPLQKVYSLYKNDPDTLNHPNYVIFFGKDDLDKRIEKFKELFPAMEYKTTIYPGYVDRFFEFLNPVNKNQTTYIYKFSEK